MLFAIKIKSSVDLKESREERDGMRREGSGVHVLARMNIWYERMQGQFKGTNCKAPTHILISEVGSSQVRLGLGRVGLRLVSRVN